ncbi:MAG: VOC family protein [Chloroflexi bacterium]|nr:MAG: VOC family protein [Chloroflexota bacterium]TMD81959.1 MAG: VOC family protein [Chloroflexota bacterium]
MSLNDAIAKTTLPVEDLARAKAFYAEKLGLRPTREFAGALFYEGNGTSGFLLFPSGAHASGQHTQMALFVKDIVASVAKLKSRGVQFEEYDFPGLKTNQSIADLGYEKAAWFRDSEGNLLALGQLA